MGIEEQIDIEKKILKALNEIKDDVNYIREKIDGIDYGMNLMLDEIRDYVSKK